MTRARWVRGALGAAWRRSWRALVVVLVATAAVVGVAAIGISGVRESFYAPRPDGARTSAVPDLRHDPDRPTVVVVVGGEGANVADTLPPYEELASTGALNVHLVAATHEPVTLIGGLDVVPQLTFDELDRLEPSGPDVAVVPQLEGPTADVVAWLGDAHRRGTTLMSVCVGAETVADTGVLDGREATSHWLKLIGLRRSHPQVDWVDGVRFVEHDDVITTAGVLSGLDGTTRVIERLLGPEAARRAADALAWTGWRPGGDLAIPTEGPRPADLVGLLSASYRFDRPRLGVLVTPGVGETELASAFRPYTELSFLGDTLAVSEDGGPVRSRHGLTFLPRGDWDDAVARSDRILVPGHEAARRRVADALSGDVEVAYLHEERGFAFDGAVTDIGRTYDVATARWVAKTLQYPAPADLTGSRWPWLPTLWPLLVATVTGTAVWTVLRRTRRAPRPTGEGTRP